MKDLGNFHHRELYEARRDLLLLKNRKLNEKASAHRIDPLFFSHVNAHFHEEYLEYLNACLDNNDEGMKVELADLSNMIDILFLVLKRGGRKS